MPNPTNPCSDIEKSDPVTCAVQFPWRMMYGEKRVLKPAGLLMDNYHRVKWATYRMTSDLSFEGTGAKHGARLPAVLPGLLDPSSPQETAPYTQRALPADWTWFEV